MCLSLRGKSKKVSPESGVAANWNVRGKFGGLQTLVNLDLKIAFLSRTFQLEYADFIYLPYISDLLRSYLRICRHIKLQLNFNRKCPLFLRSRVSEMASSTFSDILHEIYFLKKKTWIKCKMTGYF